MVQVCQALLEVLRPGPAVHDRGGVGGDRHAPAVFPDPERGRGDPQRGLHRRYGPADDPHRPFDDGRRRGRRLLRRAGVGELRLGSAPGCVRQGAAVLLRQHRQVFHWLAGHAADQRHHPAPELREHAAAHVPPRPRHAHRRADHGHRHEPGAGPGAGRDDSGAADHRVPHHPRGLPALHPDAGEDRPLEQQRAGEPDQHPRGEELRAGGLRGRQVQKVQRRLEGRGHERPERGHLHDAGHDAADELHHHGRGVVRRPSGHRREDARGRFFRLPDLHLPDIDEPDDGGHAVHELLPGAGLLPARQGGHDGEDRPDR